MAFSDWIIIYLNKNSFSISYLKQLHHDLADSRYSCNIPTCKTLFYTLYSCPTAWIPVQIRKQAQGQLTCPVIQRLSWDLHADGIAQECDLQATLLSLLYLRAHSVLWQLYEAEKSEELIWHAKKKLQRESCSKFKCLKTREINLLVTMTVARDPLNSQV